MNSKQRRKFNRKWKYRATIVERITSIVIPKITILDDLCKQKFGKNGYKFIHRYQEGVIFAFDREENFVEFKLCCHDMD